MVFHLLQDTFSFCKCHKALCSLWPWKELGLFTLWSFSSWYFSTGSIKSCSACIWSNKSWSSVAFLFWLGKLSFGSSMVSTFLAEQVVEHWLDCDLLDVHVVWSPCAFLLWHLYSEYVLSGDWHFLSSWSSLSFSSKLRQNWTKHCKKNLVVQSRILFLISVWIK